MSNQPPIVAETLAAQLLEQVRYYLETASLVAVMVEQGTALALLAFEGVVYPQRLPDTEDQLELVAFEAAHGLLDARRNAAPPSR